MTKLVTWGDIDDLMYRMKSVFGKPDTIKECAEGRLDADSTCLSEIASLLSTREKVTNAFKEAHQICLDYEKKEQELENKIKARLAQGKVDSVMEDLRKLSDEYRAKPDLQCRCIKALCHLNRVDEAVTELNAVDPDRKMTKVRITCSTALIVLQRKEEANALVTDRCQYSLYSKIIKGLKKEDERVLAYVELLPPSKGGLDEGTRKRACQECATYLLSRKRVSEAKPFLLDNDMKQDVLYEHFILSHVHSFLKSELVNEALELLKLLPLLEYRHIINILPLLFKLKRAEEALQLVIELPTTHLNVKEDQILSCVQAFIDEEKREAAESAANLLTLDDFKRKANLICGIPEQKSQPQPTGLWQMLFG